jgi:hypothetical protein
MIKRLFTIVALSLSILTTSIPTQAASNTYYITGTIKNYTTYIRYNDGTGYYSEGVEVRDTNGNIWIWEGDYNKDNDGTFQDNDKVKVKMSTCGTKSQHDDIIVSIKPIQ